MSENSVDIKLTNDEALVLFDWLSRCDDSNLHTFEDQAEQRVLWDIEATLEKSLVELFADNYKDLLEAARQRVRDAEI